MVTAGLELCLVPPGFHLVAEGAEEQPQGPHHVFFRHGNQTTPDPGCRKLHQVHVPLHGESGCTW